MVSGPRAFQTRQFVETAWLSVLAAHGQAWRVHASLGPSCAGATSHLVFGPAGQLAQALQAGLELVKGGDQGYYGFDSSWRLFHEGRLRHALPCGFQVQPKDASLPSLKQPAVFLK